MLFVLCLFQLTRDGWEWKALKMDASSTITHIQKSEPTHDCNLLVFASIPRRGQKLSSASPAPHPHPYTRVMGPLQNQ